MSDMIYNKSSNNKYDDTYSTMNDYSHTFGILDPDTIFLVLILIFVVIYYEKVDCLSNSSVIIFLLVLFIGKSLIHTYVKSNNNVEGLSIISNEALQDLGSALSNGTMTVNKQFCITNGTTTKCLNMNFFNGAGAAPLP